MATLTVSLPAVLPVQPGLPALRPPLPRGRRALNAVQLYALYVWLGIRQYWQYRGDIVFGLLHGTVSVFVQVAIWTALYGGRDALDGIALSEMITYVFLGRVVWSLVRAGAAPQLEALMTSGDIAVQLTRPGHLSLRLFFTNLGKGVYDLLLGTLPVVVIGLVWLPLKPPASPGHLVAFLLTIAGAAAPFFALDYLVGLLAFWVLKVRDLRWLVGIGTSFFSGALVPLWFFPDWLRRVCELLPFQLMYFVPNAYYLGKLDLAALPLHLAQQLLWLAVLVAGCALLWRASVRRLVVQGG